MLIIEHCNTSCVGSALLKMLNHADAQNNIHLAWVWAPCAFKKHERAKRAKIVQVSTCIFSHSETSSTIQCPHVKSVGPSVNSGFRTSKNKHHAWEVLSNVMIAIGAEELAITNNERRLAPEHQKWILRHPKWNTHISCEMCTRAYNLRTCVSKTHGLAARKCAWGVGTAAMRK